MWNLVGFASSCMRHRDSCVKRHFTFFVKILLPLPRGAPGTGIRVKNGIAPFL
ncbi:hypothetical protein T11_8459 [Trichinella zimbabwensis]|uniref:Uncharacterized protein n=1 Tax=Trichinella zimbabwensis TaxID=268475 RepID=A0A0V1GI77_9BILA|nr:hypothetical protein T11_8459 [Trichinella zimbabwensis]